MNKTPLLTPLRIIHQPGTQSRVAAELTMLLKQDSTRSLLQSRYLLRTVRQYAENHKQSFTELSRLRGTTRDHQIGAFLIRTTMGKTIGLASVQPELELRRYRQLPLIGALPFPPRFAHRTPLVTTEATQGSAVEAWTAPGYAKELREAYQQLADPTGVAEECYSGIGSWVVEPKDAPKWVHAAIASAGYEPVKTAHFEHDTSLMETPPLSVLYQHATT